MPQLRSLATWVMHCKLCGNRLEKKYVDKPVECDCGWIWKAWEYEFIKHGVGARSE